jgi:hypothetical protein
LVGGIDWGEGNDGSEKSPSGKIRNASYTVFTVGYYEHPKKFKIVYIKKYTGKEIDPDHVVRDIYSTCMRLDVRLVGADWGHGWGVNNDLIRKIGPKRLVQFQHIGKMKHKMKWDPIGYRYQLMRNLCMSELFHDLKNGFVAFPKWLQMEPYAKDILSIYTEYSEYMREIRYDHRPSDPDDFFHSLLYCKMAADIYHGHSRRHTG